MKKYFKKKATEEYMQEVTQQKDNMYKIRTIENIRALKKHKTEQIVNAFKTEEMLSKEINFYNRDNEDAYKEHMKNIKHYSNDESKYYENQDKINGIWIISPYDRNLLKFDFITCVMVLYDCFMVPFNNSFGSHTFEP